MPARSEGAGRARAGGRREGGRRRGRARALGAAGLRRRLLWRSRPEPPPSSPLLSSCSPAAAGPGPGGSRVSPGRGTARDAEGQARPRARRGARARPLPSRAIWPGGGRGGPGWRWVSLGDPRAFPGGARPGRPGGRACCTLRSQPRLLRDVEVPGSCPSARPCEGGYSLPADALGAPFLPPRLWGSAMGSRFSSVF